VWREGCHHALDLLRGGAGVAEEDDVGFGVIAEDAEGFAVGRVGVPGKSIGGEIRDLMSATAGSGAVDGLHPHILDAVFADWIDEGFAVRRKERGI
jgi:hypothetical protein